MYSIYIYHISGRKVGSGKLFTKLPRLEFHCVISRWIACIQYVYIIQGKFGFRLEEIGERSFLVLLRCDIRIFIASHERIINRGSFG